MSHYFQTEQASKNGCRCREIFIPEHIYVYDIPCIECKRFTTIGMKGEDLFKYNQGKYIQESFPYIPIEYRELLMSGICPDCFDVLFPEEDN